MAPAIGYNGLQRIVAGPMARQRPTADPSKVLDRHVDEQFAQLLASGSRKIDAYEAVYGKRNSPGATRKSQAPHIHARVEWLRTQYSQVVEESLGAQAAKIAADTMQAWALDRRYVLEKLKENVEIAMGEKLVQVCKVKKDKEGEKVISARVTMRDAGAANRALELLGKEIGMFEGEGDKEGTDKTQKAPIKTISSDAAADLLERYRSGRHPSAILGKKAASAKLN